MDDIFGLRAQIQKWWAEGDTGSLVQVIQTAITHVFTRYNLDAEVSIKVFPYGIGVLIRPNTSRVGLLRQFALVEIQMKSIQEIFDLGKQKTELKLIDGIMALKFPSPYSE